MCDSTTDAEERNNSTNTALHLSPSVSSSSPTIGNMRNNENSNRSSHSNNGSILENEDDDDDDGNGNPIFVASSLTQAGTKRAQGKPNLVLSNDGGEIDSDHLNSSFLAVNIDEGTSAGGGKKATHDRNSHAEVKSSNFCAEMIMLPVGVCQGSTDFAEQMDIFMRCQHPLDILAMFSEDEVESGVIGDSISHSDADAQVHRVSGYHAIPRSCEYCGSHNINLCRNDKKCERPKSYFRRETPPFCSKGRLKWKEENNVGIVSNGGEDDVITESTENAQKKAAMMTCSAWI